MAAALRRLLYGAEVERVRPEPEPPPPPWGTEARRCPQHRGGGERAARGGNGSSQEQPPYPEYASHYWNSQPRTAYQNAYPVGPELQGQGIDPSYANGIYGTPYCAAHGTGPPYPSAPQSATYYSSGCSHTPYPPESYRSPPPASSWNYPSPDCPAEGTMVRRQVPGYSPSQAPGFSVSPYPYGDCNHGIPQQGPPPRLQDATWQPPGIYGMQPPYGWSSASTGHGNPYAAESSSPWPASGTSTLHPPNNCTKDSYSQLDQGANQHSYFPEANRLPSGTMTDYKPVQLDKKPSVSTSQVQFSAQPQMYDNVHRKPPVIVDHGSASKINGQPQSEPLVVKTGIQKVIQVMEGVEQLEDEVDEFVGKKADKDYRLLEETLTKMLLELDSVETGGQENVRQARKEAVNRIQAILEELERKGL
ncbi:hypothetical protein lerEdw1_019859 [Lerista edwardsae]|nr:hypothetical protein lerEdw1_019859 [Lerista edwardsae]